MRETGTEQIVKSINGITYHFLVSYEANGKHITIAVSTVDGINRLNINSEDYKNIATTFLNKRDIGGKYNLISNQIETNGEWVGQFQKEQ